MEATTGGTLRAIAFYLPQFHPIPENDEWWGTGFTDWHNVARARPWFPGHYQPHSPSDLGFYDLRNPEAREAQAELARAYGIHAFCYYHYWFNGKRVLERPFEEVLASGRPDFPFCLCWANENWTRTWSGGESDVLLKQEYGFEDDRAHIRSLLPAFDDRRYVRIGGRPLFLVYRTELLPDPARTAEIWRSEARACGVGELYLARVESFVGDVDPGSIGFDAAVEFAPEWRRLVDVEFRSAAAKLLVRLRVLPRLYLENRIGPYDAMVARLRAKHAPRFTRFRCVTPGFDNSPRRRKNAVVLTGATPEAYEDWLREMATETLQQMSGDERLLFINAWNEWAEGNHLEPDHRFGRAFLEATKRVLQRARGDSSAAQPLKLETIPASDMMRRSSSRLANRVNAAIALGRHAWYWLARKEP